MTRRYSFLSLALATLLFASTTSAFEPLQPLRRWFTSSSPRLVIVDDRGVASVNDVIANDLGQSLSKDAVNAWNDADTLPPIPIPDIVDAQPGPIPDTNEILGPGTPSYLIFGDPFNVCKGSCLAATLTGFFDNTSKMLCDDGQGTVRVFTEITDSDVVLNLGYNFTTEGETDGCVQFPPKKAEYSLEAVVAHEIGHVIGLGHSQDGNALMAPSVRSCSDGEIANLLTADDRAGAVSLYGCALGDCAAAGTETGEPLCSDGIDNDCNGLTDGGEPACGGGAYCGDGVCDSGEDFSGEGFCSCTLDCPHLTSEGSFCADGLDNDCDSAIDCDDIDDCTGDPACSTSSCGGNKASCDSGADCCSGNCKNDRCRGN